jgi:hypothetical protein
MCDFLTFYCKELPFEEISNAQKQEIKRIKGEAWSQCSKTEKWTDKRSRFTAFTHGKLEKQRYFVENFLCCLYGYICFVRVRSTTQV